MSYTTKVYRDQGGDRLVVEAGGIVQLKTGGQIVGNAGTQASAIADLAGTVGAANDTMTAVPVPADTPADADALRDDIATNVIPAINNNLADLQAKVAGPALTAGAGDIVTVAPALGAVAGYAAPEGDEPQQAVAPPPETATAGPQRRRPR